MADSLRAALLGAVQGAGAPSSDYDLNPGLAPPRRGLRPAAVLVAIGPGGQLWLTKRSSRLRHHPGQVAFPGGKIDATDADAAAAALREAEEEIGLPRPQVEVLGPLPDHVTVTGFAVTPVLALVHGPFVPRPEAGEVAEVFSVPLAAVTDPARFVIERRLWQGQWRRYYAVPHGPWYIWGATARILRALADRLAR